MPNEIDDILQSTLDRLDVNEINFDRLGTDIGITPPGADTTPDNSSDYDAIISRVAQEENVDPDLVRAVIHMESRGNPNAKSGAGAGGLMQLMEGTAKEMGVQDRFDPEQNIRGGTKYLRQMLDRNGGDITLALAAYNAGQGNVNKYKGVPPFKETQGYVEGVKKVYDAFKKEEYMSTPLSEDVERSGGLLDELGIGIGGIQATKKHDPNDKYADSLGQEIKEIGQSVAGGVVGGTSSTLRGLEWMTGWDVFGDLAEPLEEFSKENLTPEHQNIVNDLANGVGSMLFFLVPGATVSRIPALVSEGVQLTRLGMIAAEAAGIGISAFTEATSEAGGTYQQMKLEGASDEEASHAALKSFALNIALIGATDKLSGFFNAAEKIGTKFLSGKTLKDAAKGFFFEGLQEGGQAIIQSDAEGKPINWGETGYQALLGGIIGGGAGVGLSYVDSKIAKDADTTKGYDESAEVDLSDSSVINKGMTKDQMEDAQRKVSFEERMRKIREENQREIQEKTKAEQDAQELAFEEKKAQEAKEAQWREEETAKEQNRAFMDSISTKAGLLNVAGEMIRPLEESDDPKAKVAATAIRNADKALFSELDGYSYRKVKDMQYELNKLAQSTENPHIGAVASSMSELLSNEWSDKEIRNAELQKQKEMAAERERVAKSQGESVAKDFRARKTALTRTAEVVEAEKEAAEKKEGARQTALRQFAQEKAGKQPVKKVETKEPEMKNLKQTQLKKQLTVQRETKQEELKKKIAAKNVKSGPAPVSPTVAKIERASATEKEVGDIRFSKGTDEEVTNHTQSAEAVGKDVGLDGWVKYDGKFEGVGEQFTTQKDYHELKAGATFIVPKGTKVTPDSIRVSLNKMMRKWGVKQENRLKLKRDNVVELPTSKKEEPKFGTVGAVLKMQQESQSKRAYSVEKDIADTKDWIKRNAERIKTVKDPKAKAALERLNNNLTRRLSKLGSKPELVRLSKSTDGIDTKTGKVTNRVLFHYAVRDNVQILDEMAGAKAPDVEIFANIYEYTGKGAEKLGPKDKGMKVGGKVILFTDNIEDMGDAIGTYMHEAIGHIGLKNFMTKMGMDYNKFLSDVHDAVSNSKTYKEMAKLYDSEVIGMNEKAKMEYLAEEFLAKRVERIDPFVKRKLWAKIRDFINDWLFKTFRNEKVELKMKDIDLVLQGATKHFFTGKLRDDLEFVRKNEEYVETVEYMIKNHPKALTWEENHQELVEKHFGEDAGIFNVLMALTSPGALVKTNAKWAVETYLYLIGKSPVAKSRFPNAIMDKLEKMTGIYSDYKVLEGGALEEKKEKGPQFSAGKFYRESTKTAQFKVAEFIRAMLGDHLSTVNDRWMYRLLFGPSRLTNAAIAKIEAGKIGAEDMDAGWTKQENFSARHKLFEITRELNKRGHKVYPAQVQAALWVREVQLSEGNEAMNDYQEGLTTPSADLDGLTPIEYLEKMRGPGPHLALARTLKLGKLPARSSLDIEYNEWLNKEGIKPINLGTKVPALNPEYFGDGVPKSLSIDGEEVTRAQFIGGKNGESILKKRPFAILTAENPGNAPLSEEQNLQRNKLLVKEMDRLGLDYTPVEGYYDRHEDSFIVFGIDRNTALDLCKQFDQESVIHNGDLVYQDGSYRPGDLDNIKFDDKLKENFTSALIKGQEVKFSIDLDWNNKYMDVIHYSGVDNLTEVDPKFMGKGQIGAERSEIKDWNTMELHEGFEYKSNWYVPKDEKHIEGHRFGMLNVYKARVNLKDVYELKGDKPTDTELKKLGYKGWYSPTSGQLRMFEPTKVQHLGRSAVTKKDFNNVTGRNFEMFITKPGDMEAAAASEDPKDMLKTDTPEFKKWFKDSKFQRAGKPLVAYHGTQAKTDFSSFALDRLSMGGISEKHARGVISFSVKPAMANRYGGMDMAEYKKRKGYKGKVDNRGMTMEERGQQQAEYGHPGRVYPVYLSVQNPFDFRNSDHVDQLVKHRARSFEDFLRNRADKEAWDIQTEEKLQAKLKSEMMEVRSMIEQGEYGILEDPKFLKANGFDGVYTSEKGSLNIHVLEPTQIKSVFNQGTFDENNPDIRFSRVEVTNYDTDVAFKIDQELASEGKLGEESFVNRLYEFTDVALQEAFTKINELEQKLYKFIGRKGAFARNADTDLTQKALHLYLDTRNTGTEVEDYYKQIKKDVLTASGEEKTRLKNQIEVIERMGKLTPEMKELAETQIRGEYNKIWTQAKDAGVLTAFVEDYARRIWKAPKGQEDVWQYWGADNERTLGSIIEGWKRGFDLRVEGVFPNMQQYAEEMLTKVAQKSYKNYGVNMMDMNGNPFLVPEGYKISVDGKPTDLFKANYRKIKHSSFDVFMPKKWEFGQDYLDEIQHTEPGGSNYKRHSLWAPKAIADEINKQYSENEDSIFNKTGLKHMMALNARMKGSILSLSMFHYLAGVRSWMYGVQGGTKNPRKAYLDGYAKIMALDPIVKLGVRNGLTIGVIQDFDTKTISEFRNLTAYMGSKLGMTKVEALGKWGRRVRENVTNHMFKRFFAGLKAEAFSVEFGHALKRAQNEALKTGEEVNVDQIAKEVAILINDDFGGLHNKRLGKHPSAAKWWRLFLLAPDWTFSNFRTVGGALGLNRIIDKKLNVLSGLQRLTGARDTQTKELTRLHQRFWVGIIGKFLVSQVMLQAAIYGLMGDDDDKVWAHYKKQFGSWDNFTKLKWAYVDITPVLKTVGMNPKTKKGLSVIGHFADPLKLTKPDELLKGKISPIGRVVEQAVTGTDWAGRPFTSVGNIPKEGLVKKSRHLSKENFWKRLPSTLVKDLEGAFPVWGQQVLGYVKGEEDAFTAIARSVGLHVPSIYNVEPVDSDFQNVNSEVLAIEKRYQNAKKIGDPKEMEEAVQDIKDYKAYRTVKKALDSTKKKLRPIDGKIKLYDKVKKVKDLTPKQQEYYDVLLKRKNILQKEFMEVYNKYH